jgi:hypothetical protein
MKFSIIILVFLFVVTFGSAILSISAIAEEISPLDLNDGYDNFEVRVGIDRHTGSYFTYHYEF